MLISQLIITPLMILFAWGYVQLRPEADSGGAMGIFDGFVLLVGTCLCVLACLRIGTFTLDGYPAVWRSVVATLSTFVIFPLVLSVGWWGRNKLFQA